MLIRTMIPFGYSDNRSTNWFDQMDRAFWGAGSSDVAPFRTDIQDTGDAFRLEAELPGFRKEDLHLDVQNDTLTISAQHSESQEQKGSNGSYICRERRWGSYQRSFDVSGIRTEDITAAYDNGVLTLNLPKRTAAVPVSHQIEIH